MKLLPYKHDTNIISKILSIDRGQGPALTSKHERLQNTVAQLGTRWEGAVTRGTAQLAPPSVIPTQIATLDQALGGGVPRGALTHLISESTLGANTIALRVIAGAHLAGALAVNDLGGTFDTDYALRCVASTRFGVEPFGWLEQHDPASPLIERCYRHQPIDQAMAHEPPIGRPAIRCGCYFDETAHPAVPILLY